MPELLSPSPVRAGGVVAVERDRPAGRDRDGDERQGATMRRARFLGPGLIASVVGLLSFSGGADTAQGGIVITTTTVQEVRDPTFQYTFTVVVDDNCILQAGDFFTVFDLYSPPDFLDIPDNPPTAPPFWTFLSPATGPSPFGPSPFDTAILNAAWIYTGPTTNPGPFVVGDFTVTIVQPRPVVPTIHFVSRCSTATGQVVAEEDEVVVTVVPEPATIGSGIAWAFGLLVLGRRRWRGSSTLT
jgi:hypothetical protein